MRERLKFFIKYIIFWLAIFIVSRIVFFLIHFNRIDSFAFIDFIQSILYGLKLDFSLLGYIMIIPLLLLSINSLFTNKIICKILDYYTGAILTIVIMLFIIDIGLYDYWGFRLDDSFLDYINTPKEMLASLTLFQIFLFIFISLIIDYFLKIIIYNNIIYKHLKFVYKSSLASFFLFIFLIPFLFFPIRGGIDTAPLNTGSVYFHKDIFYNHTAINPIWNLFYTVTEKNKLDELNDSSFNQELLKIAKSLYFDNNLHPTTQLLNTDKPNIVIIVLESFGDQVINNKVGHKEITPNINKYINEGVYFSNLYATGHFSDRGLGAILSGYPGLHNTCILHFESKSEKLPSVTKYLNNYGYHSLFLYGGDIDFAHIKSFLINSKFNQLIEKDNFPQNYDITKWGVPDHLTLKRFLNECNSNAQPFFNVIFTLSSHDPYDFPMDPVFSGNSREIKFFNSAYYTDSCLGCFIENAKTKKWWKNSLIILVADHGNRINNEAHYYSGRFKIPMLWLGGSLNISDTIISKYCSQTDIPLTILNQLSIVSNDFKFSKDILNSNSKSFATYAFNNGYGYINDSVNLIYDCNIKDYIELNGKYSEKDIEINNSLMKYLKKDFLNR